MADNSSSTGTAGGGEDSNKYLKVGIAFLSVLAVALGGYYFYSKKAKPAAKKAAMSDKQVLADEADKPDTKVESKSSSESSPVSAPTGSSNVTIANTPATGSGVSPIRTVFDSVWNYQKRQGVWYTAKKDGTVLWTSLANNQVATDKLNAAYPND